ncbi:MAG: alpha/beta hydrolase [bacterium]|nr:alpha/beta hydrolase [bacterium]
MRLETIILNENRNVTLTAYIQETDGEFLFPKRPAILVLPGGGYAMCSDREADPVAMAYLKAGYQAFILRYSTGKHKTWPNPLEDYEQAMALIKERAEEWHLDSSRIAAVGFSAGGHLCACAATIAKHKPAAAILVYPAILKDICDLCQPGMPQPNEHVTGETSPCFLVACRDDRTVDIKNSLMMELALAEHGIPFESHIYAYGGHGFSTAEDWVINNSRSTRVPDWVEDSIGWLKETLGTLTMKGISEPNIAVSKNGDTAPVLSVMCTLNHLRKQPGEVQAVLKPLFDGMQAVANARGYAMESLMASVGNCTVRELMEMVQIDADAISEMDKVLHSMVNTIR